MAIHELGMPPVDVVGAVLGEVEPNPSNNTSRRSFLRIVCIVSATLTLLAALAFSLRELSVDAVCLNLANVLEATLDVRASALAQEEVAVLGGRTPLTRPSILAKPSLPSFRGLGSVRRRPSFVLEGAVIPL